MNPCPTCLVQAGEIVMCTDASQGCDGGTVCVPLVATPAVDIGGPLTLAPTTLPPEATKSTITYALLCGGLCVLVFVLYGVLRWSQRQKKLEAGLDSEGTAVLSEPDAAANGALDSTYSTMDKVASLRPPPTKSLEPQPQRKNTGGSVHDDPATYSMFHTVGRISGVHKYRASSLLSTSHRKDDSIIYIMEDDKVSESD
ncbi:hypothetical protein ACHHYP_15389 [Achlya hypogyna]|uniref:Uncharacterized protein n=1 Tax=Achlya hypogyna TaxID=1202772 RepID=A0A1V9YAZ8_ACHHY|nr:hypothetical protein ACHHYP_15389 [Achlya hypogyna]